MEQYWEVSFIRSCNHISIFLGLLCVCHIYIIIYNYIYSICIYIYIYIYIYRIQKGALWACVFLGCLWATYSSNKSCKGLAAFLPHSLQVAWKSFGLIWEKAFSMCHFHQFSTHVVISILDMLDRWGNRHDGCPSELGHTLRNLAGLADFWAQRSRISFQWNIIPVKRPHFGLWSMIHHIILSLFLAIARS